VRGEHILREKILSVLKQFISKVSKATFVLARRQNLAYLPLIFFALIAFMGNVRERKLASLFFDPRVYTKHEIEGFVTLASAYTPVIDEEPVLTADILGYQNTIAFQDQFIERPELLETLPSQTEEVQLSDTKPQIRTEIVTYTVEDGDTLSKIAGKFNLAVKTISDANSLTSVNLIKPGQKLSILPTNGLVYTVQKGDTLSAVVKKYSGDLASTIKYNSENIQPGQKIVVVGGKAPTPAPTPSTSRRLANSRSVVTRETSSGRNLSGSGSRSNGYPWGWCTWYAASRRNIPRQWGNAGSWLSSARSSGYATGSAPQVGAIVVTRESWYGHVGYVESVSGNSVTISEMNYNGWGVVSRRTIPANSGVVKGYIY